MKYNLAILMFLLSGFGLITSCKDKEIEAMQEQLHRQSEIINYKKQRGYDMMDRSYAENNKIVKPCYDIAQEVKSFVKELNLLLEDTVNSRIVNHKNIGRLFNGIYKISETTAINHTAFIIPDSDPGGLYFEFFNDFKNEDKNYHLKLALVKSVLNQWEFDFIKNLHKLTPKDYYKTAEPILFTQVNKTQLKPGESLEVEFHYFSVLTSKYKYLSGNFNPDKYEFIGKPDTLEMDEGVGIYNYAPQGKNDKLQIEGAIFIAAPDGSPKYYYCKSEKIGFE
ncbi:MAG: hypothetical protein M3Q58_09800 [Bacteroidota bacterium]|nr:hypothetical protein [Bacteroidota bacterium]